MASQPHSPVNFDVPKGAADCHTHIFDPDRFPYAPGHAYTPESASVDEMRSLHRALHTDHVVIVQPSVYGTDNSCTLDAIEQLGHTARGIAVIGEKVTQAELDQMHRRGIKGVRVNLETTGEADPALAKQRFKAAVDQIKGPRNWHVQIYTRLSVIEALKNEIATCPVRVSIDHMGSAQAALGVHQPGFATLVGLVRSGKAYVKVSAPYRLSTKAPDYADVTPLAKALIAANPQRILWGTDWPHPQQIAGRSAKELTPLYQIDDGRDFNLFAAWVPDAARRKTILVDNPAKLYGF
jgi:predicted TIM-barrel fold metal-dependent hydrolase